MRTTPLLLFAAVLLGTSSPVTAQAVLSAFEGSTEKGVFESDFEAMAYAEAAAADAPVSRAEGSLLSRVFLKPEGKSNLEVFRSYQSVLQAGGFTIHVAAESGSPTELLLRKVYRAPHTAAFNSRAYRPSEATVTRTDLDRLATQGDYYLVASQTVGGATRWVSIVICRFENLYMVEELTEASMSTGTVTLNLEAMKTGIEQTGKIAIYDIHFETGSAVIQPTSAEALAVVVQYLNEVSGSFYIVGHTDDTGGLASNLELSEARAAAVKDALVADGIDTGRLETRGVGPLAPVSTNTGEDGRALNRRVEIVQRIGGES